MSNVVTSAGSAQVEAGALARLARYSELARGAHFANTVAAVRSETDIFSGWCRQMGVTSLPADLAVVAAFVDAMGEGRAPATVRRDVSSRRVAKSGRGGDRETLAQAAASGEGPGASAGSAAARMLSPVTAACLVFCLQMGSAHADSFTWTSIKVPKAAQTLIAGVNDVDQVVGSAQLPGGSQAFVWTKGSFVIVPASIGMSSINSKGLAASLPGPPGHYAVYNTMSGQQHVYNGHVRTIYMSGINASGTMCGSAVKADRTHLFAMAKGKAVTLLQVPGSSDSVASAINDAGTIIGYNFGPQPQDDGFAYSGGTFTTINPPGSIGTDPLFITGTGVIGGVFQPAGDKYATGFIFENGAYTTIAYPGATAGTLVTGIGPDGEIVGSFGLNGAEHGFIYENNTYYQIDYPGQIDTNIVGVNARGSLIGSYYVNNKAVGFIAQCAAGAFCTN